MFLSLSRQSSDLQDHIWSRITQVMDVQRANSKGEEKCESNARPASFPDQPCQFQKPSLMQQLSGQCNPLG
jgi:hypothetical protein